MRITKKILSEKEQEIMHDFYESTYWDVFKKLNNRIDLNIMKKTMVGNFSEEFHHSKGQLYRWQEIQRILKLNHQQVEKEDKDAT